MEGATGELLASQSPGSSFDNHGPGGLTLPRSQVGVMLPHRHDDVTGGAGVRGDVGQARLTASMIDGWPWMISNQRPTGGKVR